MVTRKTKIDLNFDTNKNRLTCEEQNIATYRPDEEPDELAKRKLKSFRIWRELLEFPLYNNVVDDRLIRVMITQFDTLNKKMAEVNKDDWERLRKKRIDKLPMFTAMTEDGSFSEFFTSMNGLSSVYAKLVLKSRIVHDPNNEKSKSTYLFNGDFFEDEDISEMDKIIAEKHLTEKGFSQNDFILDFGVKEGNFKKEAILLLLNSKLIENFKNLDNFIEETEIEQIYFYNFVRTDKEDVFDYLLQLNDQNFNLYNLGTNTTLLKKVAKKPDFYPKLYKEYEMKFGYNGRKELFEKKEKKRIENTNWKNIGTKVIAKQVYMHILDLYLFPYLKAYVDTGAKHCDKLIFFGKIVKSSLGNKFLKVLMYVDPATLINDNKEIKLMLGGSGYIYSTKLNFSGEALVFGDIDHKKSNVEEFLKLERSFKISETDFVRMCEENNFKIVKVSYKDEKLPDEAFEEYREKTEDKESVEDEMGSPVSIGEPLEKVGLWNRSFSTAARFGAKSCFGRRTESLGSGYFRRNGNVKFRASQLVRCSKLLFRL